jgi:uncharacterized protein YabN with tetrapyrrole methylase and pyrophosphatase domain
VEQDWRNPAFTPVRVKRKEAGVVYKMSYSDIEMKVLQWSEARKIIPNSTPIAQWKKAMEEMDELRDGIAWEKLDETKDAVGDVMVCLINICALLDINLVDCLKLAYEEIKDRKGYMNEEGIFVKETK